jgi:hypothetical protein
MNSSPSLTDDSYGLGRTLIDDLLDEQQLLTPVAKRNITAI